jgi:hypothetical protein
MYIGSRPRTTVYPFAYVGNTGGCIMEPTGLRQNKSKQSRKRVNGSQLLKPIIGSLEMKIISKIIFSRPMNPSRDKLYL